MPAAVRLHSRYPHNVKVVMLVYNDLVSSPRCVVQDCEYLLRGNNVSALGIIKRSGTLGAGCEATVVVLV